MKTLTSLRQNKILAAILFTVFCIHSNAQSTYLLNLSDPSTYNMSCGTANSTVWTVSNANCTLTTSSFQLEISPLTQTLAAAITIEGASMDNGDIAIIDYCVNGNWTNSATVHGEAGLHTYTHNFYMTASGGSICALRINLINNTNSESWRIFDGKVIVSPVNPLPVTLIAFSGEKVRDGVRLNWSTATETNCGDFTVEKSSDGINFCAIDRITGAGNSSTQRNYYAIDEEAIEGRNYYRLIQTDFNGTTHEAGTVITVDYCQSRAPLDIYPNPSNGSSFFIHLNDLRGEKIIVVITDEMGRELYSKVALTGAYAQTIEVCDLDERLRPGVYVVTASSETDLCQQKILVK